MSAVLPANLYELLLISPDSSFQDIRRAYRRRALDSHPDKQKSAVSSAASDAPSLPPPFVVVAAAATLLLDPVRRRQYDQLLFLNRLATAGRVSNADEVTFGLEGDGGGGEFVLISDDEKGDACLEEGEDAGSFRWCGLECRCGGWYRVSIPSIFFAEGGSRLLDEQLISPPPSYRTNHVECESCSLVIAVEGVPTLGDVAIRKAEEDDERVAQYKALFLGLEI